MLDIIYGESPDKYTETERTLSNILFFFWLDTKQLKPSLKQNGSNNNDFLLILNIH